MRRVLACIVLVSAAVAVMGGATRCWAQEAGPDGGPPLPAVVLYLADLGAITMVDGEWVENTLDLWVWVELNRCEHAHVWHNEDGRDGAFRGGLQFHPGTWRAYGGGEYGWSPEQASINDQIRVARLVKERQGWGAWPGCTRSFGWR